MKGQVIRCVVVGDSFVGKKCMTESYFKDWDRLQGGTAVSATGNIDLVIDGIDVTLNALVLHPDPRWRGLLTWQNLVSQYYNKADYVASVFFIGRIHIF